PKLMGNHQGSSLQVCESTKKRFDQETSETKLGSKWKNTPRKEESTKRGLGEQGSSHVCTSKLTLEHKASRLAHSQTWLKCDAHKVPKLQTSHPGAS
ncbi:hypothetical protein PIB30_093113, partial [Stylosanthes scabra]|nr:hypothetical protein [Stylosanthes scabra]